MKTIPVIIILSCILASCASVRPVQTEMVRAELIKIDTVHRQQDDRKVLTWRDQDNIEYVTFTPMSQSFPLGVSMVVMRRR